MATVYGSEEKLKQELCKLKFLVKKSGQTSYNKVVWFLLNYYKESEGLK